MRFRFWKPHASAPKDGVGEACAYGQGPLRPQMWKRPNSIGDVEAVKGLGGVIAPLLAGFCLTTIAVLATSSDTARPPLAGAAVAVLSAAGVLFLLAVEFSFYAVRRRSPPSVYLDWDPDYSFYPGRLQELREEQAADTALFDHYNRLAAWTYNTALLLFLLALALVVIPKVWQLWNGVALGCIALALGVECLSMWPRLLPPISRLLFPDVGEIKRRFPSRVDELSAEQLEHSTSRH